MSVFLFYDASALIKRYSIEIGTPAVNDLFANFSAKQRGCSVIGILEVLSILTRKRNDGRINNNLYQAAVYHLNQDFIQNPEVMITSIIDDDITQSLKIIPNYNINSSDALILATALRLKLTMAATNTKLVLCTSDKRLIRAGLQEQVVVFDPEVDSVQQFIN
ncbi:PIN domain-containing protein [Herpetosiphon giganteus]|uniref:PIN domain-containing protein n=1 Tax=Herpetosiphon giganteus TaxID=2029754 RepID=UPI00195BEFE3|nr:putative nucleic acid-binding protein [Herpetosiphon giganteus]